MVIDNSVPLEVKCIPLTELSSVDNTSKKIEGEDNVNIKEFSLLAGEKSPDEDAVNVDNKNNDNNIVGENLIKELDLSNLVVGNEFSKINISHGPLEIKELNLTVNTPEIGSDSSNGRSPADNGILPDKFFEDRTSPNIDLTVFDIDKSNYDLGARTVICALLHHFGIKNVNPNKIKGDDLLLHLANLDRKILANLNANIPFHFSELGTLDNIEILDTPNNREELTVQHVINYVRANHCEG